MILTTRLGALLIGLCGLTAACGGSGSGGSDDDGGGDDGGGGVIDQEPTAVTGQFFLGDANTPAVGHEVWFLDHEDGTYLRQDLDPSGKFSVPIESFVEDHVYSIELVRDYQSLGPVDLSTANAGVQAGFLYRGGYGFDLGRVTLALDQYGRYDPSAGSLRARVGGGFSLSQQSDLSLATVPLPEDVTKATMASALVVTDPQTMLSAFYRRTDNPDAYQRALAESSRVDLNVTTARNDMYEVVEMLQAGTWLGGSRVAKSTASAWASAERWSETEYILPKTGKKTYVASIFTGRILPVGAVAVLQLQPKTDASRVVPVISQHSLTMPPSVVAAGFNGGGAAVIDYTSPTAENGLTRAFCRTGDVSLSLTRPRDHDGAVVAATDVDVVKISFDYYGQADGRSVALKVKSSDFPSNFDDDYEDTPSADLTRQWEPSTRTLTLVYSDAAKAASEQTFDIWSDLFLSEAGGGGVFSIRARVSYVLLDGSHADTIVWFNEEC